MYEFSLFSATHIMLCLGGSLDVMVQRFQLAFPFFDQQEASGSTTASKKSLLRSPHQKSKFNTSCNLPLRSAAAASASSSSSSPSSSSSCCSSSRRLFSFPWCRGNTNYKTRVRAQAALLLCLLGIPGEDSQWVCVEGKCSLISAVHACRELAADAEGRVNWWRRELRHGSDLIT